MTYLEYKGYQGTIESQLDNGTLYGKIAFIRDLVTYCGPTLEKLTLEFKISVDEYLEDCLKLGKIPNKPFISAVNFKHD
ncbi:MAG: type II toxin-antitoxin system HicB family antitoxin [Neptuniibacter sp.]